MSTRSNLTAVRGGGDGGNWMKGEGIGQRAYMQNSQTQITEW